MLILADELPRFCPCCGMDLGEPSSFTVKLFHAGDRPARCKCGAGFQFALADEMNKFIDRQRILMREGRL